MTTLQRTLIAWTAAAAIGIGIYQAREAARLRDRSEATSLPALRAELAQPERGSAGSNAASPPSQPLLLASSHRIIPSTNSPVPESIRSSQVYALLTNKVSKLSLAQVEPYLNSKGRSAASLLAAFRTTTNASLLAEAMLKHSSDPQVQFEAALQLNATPEERRRWLDAFKQGAPENSLANYLSASDNLKAGRTEDALQDLASASRQHQFQDYLQDRTQTDEEVYLAAGYPPAEAKLAANAFLVMPYLIQIRELGQNLISLANGYQQSGDQASRDAALQMAVSLGQRFGTTSGGETLIRQLVGINVEPAALRVTDPTSPYGGTGQTVQNRIDQLAQQKETFRSLAAQADPLWPALSDQDWIGYHRQLAALGEETALRWLVSNHAPH